MKSAISHVAPDIGTLSCRLNRTLGSAVKRAEMEWDRGRKTQRLWDRDSSVWTSRDEHKWLGWLAIVDRQIADISKFKALAAEVAEDAFRHLLVLGTGGSSLCPAVFGAAFGKQAGFPELLVLDSTDPEQIRSIRGRIDPARTLFCVSSKSGTTLEPNLLLQYFFAEARKVVGERAGHHFIAITDPGSQLEGVAEKLAFRRVYCGVPGIAGGYSALSDFGLAPHAAAGLDTEKLLHRARQMVDAAKEPSAAENPGVHLGIVLGVASEAGQDKATLVCSPALREFGPWLELLLAESTGKHGSGLIPIDREPFVSPADYGNDRVFVSIELAGDRDLVSQEHLAALESAGHTLVRVSLRELSDIGQLFFQWEVAAAVAAAVIRINPFDRSDVEAREIVTRQLTSAFDTTGSLPPETPIFSQDGIKLFADEASAPELTLDAATGGAVIRRHLDRLQPGDFFGLLAYLPPFPEHEALLQGIRKDVLESKQAATVLGFGPRFLHGAGQAYKGGPNSGVFLQITCDDAHDVPVPQEKYTFGIVESAQARSDSDILVKRQRRVLRVHLGSNVTRDLKRVRDWVCAAVAH